MILTLLVSHMATAQAKPTTDKVAPKKETTPAPPEKQQLTYKIIPSEQNSFGYDILDNNRPFVHQPSVPGLPGNKGFTKKEDAEKVAKLVIYKISKNIMPPTVTKQEMDSLKLNFRL